MGTTRVLFVANPTKAEALRLAEEACGFLGPGTEGVVETSRESDLARHEADLVVTFGGDGTVLDAVRRLGDAPPPILTVNLGRLGYLAEVPPERLESALERALAGASRVSERMLLECTIEVESAEGKAENGGGPWRAHALNEVAITPRRTGRLLEIALAVDDRPLSRFVGDGVIVATPTGSTAYALSAGGPILSPELRAMVLVPICPHHLANRPLVLGAEETVRARVISKTEGALACDGREERSLGREERVEIRASARAFRLVLDESLGRYDILRAKLGWGGRELGDRDPD